MDFFFSISSLLTCISDDVAIVTYENGEECQEMQIYEMVVGGGEILFQHICVTGS